MLTSVLKETQGTSIMELENELREKGLYDLVLSKINIKSKKKRVRKKVLKKAIALVNVIELTEEKENDETKVMVSPASKLPEINLEKMPITFLLKLAKQYLRDELIVKNYYNSNEVEFYKNKPLLVHTLELQIPKMDSSSQNEIIESLMEQQNKKTKV